MEDSKYTLGLLIASCLILVVAIVITWAEIGDYKETMPVAKPAPAVTHPGAGAVPARVAVPAPTPGATAPAPTPGATAPAERAVTPEAGRPAGAAPATR